MAHSNAKHAKKLLDLMPNGTLMKDKHTTTTNHYKWWLAIAMYFVLIENDWAKVIAELGISTTETLIERWEKEFGLPDGLIDIAATLAERRANVLLKKGGLNLLTIAEFQAILDRLDIDATLINSTTIRYPPYSVPFYPLDTVTWKFVVGITADLSDAAILELIDYLETLLPINVAILTYDV